MSAGDDFTVLEDQTPFILRGQGSDPDRHWLHYTWTDETGTVRGRTPSVPIYDQNELGSTRTYTLTVSDGHGGTARDSVVTREPAQP